MAVIVLCCHCSVQDYSYEIIIVTGMVHAMFVIVVNNIWMVVYHVTSEHQRFSVHVYSVITCDLPAMLPTIYLYY